jgi:hypothetical protein
MTSHTLQPKPFPDLPAAETSSSRLSSPDASAAGALLRALLAGAIALLVLLLPAPLGAVPGADDGRYGAWAVCDPAAVDGPWCDPAGGIEIRRPDTCFSW